METQPQLLLLQKTMVVVEGVARDFDPRLNMWTISEPVVEEWMKSKLGPEGRLNDAVEGAAALGKLVEDFPELVAGAQRTLNLISSLAVNSASHPEAPSVVTAPSSSHSSNDWPAKTAVWVGAAALVVIAISQVVG